MVNTTENDNFVKGTNVMHLEYFELVGDLYYRRFRRLRPGKSEPIGFESSNADENLKQFEAWAESGQSFSDAIQEISRLKGEIKDAYEKLQEVDNILYRLKA